VTVDSVKLLLTRRKGNLWVWPLLFLLTAACAGSIVFLPFPQNLAALFVVPLVVMTWYDMRMGIGIWFVLSALGNMFVLDLPGIVPLRPAHLILLLLLGIWFVKSYDEIPAAVARFLSTRKNQVLLILLAWIALSMVMGRLTGVTQKNWKYQFNAWFSVALAILLALLVSSHVDRGLLKAIIWLTVALGTVLTGAVLVTGFLSGVGLGGWKAYYYGFLRSTGLIIVHPLYLAIVFFPEQKWWGKGFFALGIVLSFVLHVLMALSGSRSDLFPLITLGFLFFLTRPRWLVAFAALVILPIMALNATAVETWVGEQVEYTVDRGVVIGRGARIGLWLDALETIQRHPVWGTGSDFYRLHASVKVIGSDLRGNRVAKWSTDAHNTWLQAAVDHGIPGAVLLVIFFAYLLRDSWRVYRRSPDSRLYWKYALLFLAGFCTTFLGSPFGENVLPVFTATRGAEEVLLAPYLVRFWLSYGILLGIENWRTDRPSVTGPGEAVQ